MIIRTLILCAGLLYGSLVFVSSAMADAHIYKAVLKGFHVKPQSPDACSGTMSVPSLGDSCRTGALGGGTHALYAGGSFSGGGNYRYMITPSGCDGSNPANPSCNIVVLDGNTKTWGANPSTPSPTPNSITDGSYNTDILGAPAESNAYPAAQYCKDLVWGGYDDWYLPACGATGTGEAYNILYTMKTAGKGNLRASPYWGSTMISNSNAWIINPSTGNSATTAKTNPYYVRCIRRYTL